MNIGSAAIGLGLLIGFADAQATQTTVPMRECANCTAAQMQTTAKNAQVGINFVYDMQHGVIHRYDTYMDSSCRTGSDPGPVSRSEDPERSAESDPNSCGSFKVADLADPVESGVQAIFNSLRTTWQVNPTLANSSHAYFRGNPPTDPNTNQPYDMSGIAWDYPQQSYVRFMEHIQFDVLISRLSANAFIPGLGDMIYGVGLSLKQVSLGFPINAKVDVALDRTTATILIDICNPNGDCAKLNVTLANGQVAAVNYTGVFDTEQNMYPSESGAAPGHMNHFGFSLGPDADHFGQGLQSHGVFVPFRDGCGSGFHSALQIVRGSGLVTAEWSCLPN
jgi:hypothetical protein